MSWYRMHRGWMDNPILKGKFCRALAWEWLIAEAAFDHGKAIVAGKVADLSRGQLSHSIRHIAGVWGWSKDATARFLKALQRENMIRVETATGQLLITICNYELYQAASDNNRDDSATGARQRPRQEFDDANPRQHLRENRDTFATADDTARYDAGDCYQSSFLDIETQAATPGDRDPRQERDSGEDKYKELKKVRNNNIINARATRLPEDWFPSEIDWQRAVVTLGTVGAEDQLDRFRDYWAAIPGQKGLKLDWAATWRNWVRKAGESYRPPPRKRDGMDPRDL